MAVGVGSYSLYVWQELFMNPSSGWAVGRFPLNVALAGAAAVASYFLIERPCLRLREQWERTRGSVVAAAQ